MARVSFHEDLSREEVVHGSSERTFGLVFAALFLVIGLWPLLAGNDVRLWSLGVSAAFLLIALIRPQVLRPLNRQWLRLGHLLHRIVSPIILAIVFFGVLTPIGWLRRRLVKDPLGLRFDPDAATYWKPRVPAGPSPSTLRNQF